MYVYQHQFRENFGKFLSTFVLKISIFPNPRSLKVKYKLEVKNLDHQPNNVNTFEWIGSQPFYSKFVPIDCKSYSLHE